MNYSKTRKMKGTIKEFVNEYRRIINFYKIKMIKYTKNFSNINHQGKLILRDPIQMVI